MTEVLKAEVSIRTPGEGHVMLPDSTTSHDSQLLAPTTDAAAELLKEMLLRPAILQ